MASVNYELGGILQAIKKSTSPSEEETSEDKISLENLFSYKPRVQKSLEKEVELSEIKTYVEAEDVQIGDSKSIQSNKSSKEKEKDNAEKKKKKVQEDPERLSRTVFVGNVPISATRKTLKKLFLNCGVIETVRIRSVPTADAKTQKKVALIKKIFHNDRDSMNAYIVFKEKDSAIKALEKNGFVLEDHHLRLDLCSKKSTHDHKRCIFVGNLSFTVKEEDIRDHFKDCGIIEDIRVIRDKITGLGKGFAYVRFKDKDGVIFGLKLNGSSLNNRKIRISRSSDQTQNKGHSQGKSNLKPTFGGLRSTSKKDRELGKRIFGNPTNKTNNALRRLENKKRKQVQNKQIRNKQKKIKNKFNGSNVKQKK